MQLDFFPTTGQYKCFPKTRYLGSKKKLLPLLHDVFSSLDFESALDPFSGTGSVAYLLKTLGKRVSAADRQLFNCVAARALVENDRVTLGDEVSDWLNRTKNADLPPGFVETVFDGRFYFREENRFIDRCLHVIGTLSGYARDLMLFALGQACLAKRPYNLFHRANLNMRTREVKRSFGNKATWDKPFDEHIAAFSREADAAVFKGNAPVKALCADVFEHDAAAHDLVYLDPPYISAKGAAVDYADYYHFLDGLAKPDVWPDRVLYAYKHRPMTGKGESPFSDPTRIAQAFEDVIRHYAKAQLVISYRSDGLPSIEAIIGFLQDAGKQVTTVDAGQYTYALSTNRVSREVVLIGR